MIRVLISAIIWVVICLPATILGVFVVPVLLKTSWDRRTTIWGNSKWGGGTTHPDHMVKGFLGEFLWLAWRNPTYNLGTHYLSVGQKPYQLEGKVAVGDKVGEGWYFITMKSAWEFYYIKAYTVFGSRRCVRFRAGWKIESNDKPRASFVFALNPVKSYKGK